MGSHDYHILRIACQRQASPWENPATTTRTIAIATILVGSGWPTILIGDSQSCRTPGACEWRGGDGGAGDGEWMEMDGRKFLIR